MLFNSYEFLFGFLPLALTGFFLLGRCGLLHAAAAWLALASLFFYGFWNPAYLLLLLGSIVVNFAFAQEIGRLRVSGRPRGARGVLVMSLAANLGTLAYYKYANFFVESIQQVTGIDLVFDKVVLPLGISFFTFTQIAFLVDTFQGKATEPRFVHYALFVTYFPHLIAGPVLHHAEMMPQFADSQVYRFQIRNFTIGAAFFLIGIFKKVILADELQPFVGPVFEADSGYSLSAIEAWGGVVAYSLQLYFDFSGYSDMAIGLSRLFNIRLPLNFNSPYKATNVIEFWRRWHMTLSRFLRDYLYVALGGNRKGRARRYVNLLVTMLLGGLWHGAGWTFVVWGGVHGLYLIINHGWRKLREQAFGHDLSRSSVTGRFFGVLATLACVMVAWVFFRAQSLDSAMRVLRGMCGLNGWLLPLEWAGRFSESMPIPIAAERFGNLEAFEGTRQAALTGGLLLAALVLPNSQQIVGRIEEWLRSAGTGEQRWAWSATGFMGVVVFVIAAINGSRGISEFIYYNF